MKFEKQIYSPTHRTYMNKSTIIIFYAGGISYYKYTCTHRDNGPACVDKTNNLFIWVFEGKRFTENEYWNK